MSAELEEVRFAHGGGETVVSNGIVERSESALISFEMSLDFEDLQLELRDSGSKRVVTLSSTGTMIKLMKRPELVDFDFRVRTFAIIDGSRGATAPFRRLAYAGMNHYGSGLQASDSAPEDSFAHGDQTTFIVLSYRGDLVNHEQSLAVKILSLHMVCVRETYFALADFFYLNKNKIQTPESSYRASHVSHAGDAQQFAGTDRAVRGGGEANSDDVVYSDPFNALGMTTSSAAKALREQAERRMEQTKQAIANRGRLHVTADLDGLNLTLVSADGAIGSFDVTNCRVGLTQFSNGAIEASGNLGGFGVQDLTSAHEVYSETIRYTRRGINPNYGSEEGDGWSLSVPESETEDVWLEARLTNLRIVYLQRFIIILKKYFDALRDSLKPVLEMKGGIGEVFQGEEHEEFPAIPRLTGRMRLKLVTENVDIVMPRHSQSPYEALRFFVPHSSISNEDRPSPGYRIGFQVNARDVNAHVLYRPPAEGEGRALTLGGKEPVLQQISPTCPISDLTPFAEGICIVAKLDAWRSRRVPQVILNTDGIPVLKDGEEEREYDPAKWLPTIRVRVCAPNGIYARLCEAEYSILYFTFTENVIERPDIEFTDIVRGLKTPVLPRRKPVQPIMFSSNRMPANYQILFEVPVIESTIMYGADPRAEEAKLIKSELRDLLGCFEYGVDYRMSVEVSANMNSLVDIRPSAPTYGETLVMPTTRKFEQFSNSYDGDIKPQEDSSGNISEDNRSIALTWDRPFGFRANVMVVASDLRIIVEPELFRDLGNLTAPGFPFLKSSAPAPLLRFNGRLLILTISRPEVWLMANQYPGDARSLVIRGDVIAKVQWAAVTGRNRVEVAANGIHVNLSILGPHRSAFPVAPSSPLFKRSSSSWNTDVETPMLYPCDVSMKFDGSGYDPPKTPGEEPIKAPGSTLSVNAESILVRIDVNDAPLILAVGSRLVRLQSSVLSVRPPQPGRFDEWIDKGEEGDARLAIHFALPHSRLMFTDETAGRYVPIMEARLRNAVLRSNFPWLLNAAFEFALDLFNEEKGWWEPGIETFPIEFAASQGRSGSRAVNVRAERVIDINVTPITVSGAARVSNALKSAIEDLASRMRAEVDDRGSGSGTVLSRNLSSSFRAPEAGARRPSVAAFSVRNETGRSLVMWLLHDSTRWTLRGNGDEREVDTPTDEMLWTAIGASGGLSSDPNKNRQLAMRCVLLFSGYEAVTLSTAETGARLVTLVPDTRELGTLPSGNRGELTSQTFVWAVSMKHGVPCGCIRSLLRLVNKTSTVLEVNAGDLSKSASAGEQMKSLCARGSEGVDRKATVLLKAGASWSVPVHSVNRSIRIRPAIFHAPDNDMGLYEDNDRRPKARGRVRYSYTWSDPLSKMSALHTIAQSLRAKARTGSDGELKTHGPIAPILTCRKAEARGFFCMSIFPLVDTKAESPIDGGSGVGSWVDVHICPPLVIENIMPRRLSFKLATSGAISASGKEQVVGYGTIEPSREAHIHTAGSDLNALSISMGFDNSPQASETNIFSHSPPHRSFGTYHPNLASLRSISMGAGKYTPLKLSLIQEQRVNTRYVRAYCEFWIRNRSDTDLFFRNHGPGRDGYESGSPKAFLRGCPPGTVAEKFICFSGSWMSFQRVDVTEDIWVNIGTEVSEIDKPVPIKFDGLSLFLEVRPAKGRFQRALVVTIRNAAWLENRTGALLQWCQPEALNPHGIALAAKVHSIEPDKHCALHCDFRSHKTALCFRRATADGLSDWIWSRPVFVTGVEGEFAAKMYRPKRHEQYIARVVVSKIGNGVSSIIVHKEDRSTPPYRIVNLCNARSIAFRQSGVNETHPWLVRPGKSTRYSWDDPQAPVKRRSLVIEVLEGTSGRDGAGNVTLLATSEADSAHADESDVTRLQGGLVRKPKGAKASKFDLNIDIIRKDIPFSNSKRFDPPLCISVHVDGPTKVVTFRDGEGKASKSTKQIERGEVEDSIEVAANSKSYGPSDTADASGNVDVELFVKGLGISFVESTPAELAYLSVSGIHFRLDRFDGQQLVICEVMDLQLDNQLSHCTWPVVLWSPPPPSTGVIGRMTERAKDGMSSSQTTRREPPRKPFFQFTLHGQYPAIEQRIGSFRGIFVALQELQLAADEDFVLRVWLFVVSLLEAAGGSNREREEALDGKDGAETGLALLANDNATTGTKQRAVATKGRASGALNRIYVEHLELCPLKLSVSFTSSRTSSAAEHIGGFRSLIRTLVAVLGNVENAEFRFNALELQHVFDTASHFRSLITEYYVSQGSNQKMVLLASNSLIGNPSALFDSIAIGTRDFFVEPANAKGSADFIASIGRGSSSLLTNTVGGIVGSLGGIPRAVAQGLETAVGDREYLAERDSIRGGRARIASSPAQGLYTGALSFGHGIASGAAGLIRDPIQGAAEEGPSGFIKGLGKGFIGGMLKPITGALDLIAEPAAGFRSMMVSDRSHGLAEPARPPRAFWGANADQMISYDLRAALGHAILRVVNSGENQSNEERLLSWTHLVAVHSGATEDDVIAFLWALMRRSTRSSHFHTKYLLDAQGNPQRAEKMRAGLVTNKRLIVASLDGHVIWEYPLLHIADTQVSVAAKDYLMVGIRPLGQKSRTTAPTGWQKIHCGSISSRNDFNTALRKALDDLRITTKAVLPIPQNILLAKKSAAGQGVREHYRDGSLELADLSNSMQQGTESGNMYELKSLHQDASVDGRRGVFTDMKLPGRSSNTVRSQNMSLTDQDISLQLQKIANSASAISIDAARSVRLIVVNLTEHALRLVCSSLDSGAWVQEPTSTIEKRSVSLFEADGTADRAKDISGRIVMQVGTDGGKSGKMFIIRFLNPLLASNAYAVEAPAGFVARFQGGEKGNHVETVITLASESNLQGIAVSKKQESISRKAPAEPLLFGRSQVSPFLLPLNSKPPHAPQNPSADPRDPELIAKLSSLGFSSEESMSALEECDADLAAAYALLLDRKPKE
ncbi:unnamed protein product [Chondrus crispus]|uniref:UBA domain-containing protein n=1 Tax=Chondrus crispus TaxID=2769 RepID=R7QQZ7_CHOCR|nr:unnamed protein product [Chondrus crispus]CDF40534.1 unnamed protein product [Chondrus crispus]|eukprot:XP_005710828.1 unnamed protein product [Chondrus crispus]